MKRNNDKNRLQSSLELLITISFGIMILLPIIVIGFMQITNSNSTLSATVAQQSSNKLASAAASVASSGPGSKEMVLIQIPPNIKSILIGNNTNGVGHEIKIIVYTTGGNSDIISYTLVNVSGNLGADTLQGQYLVNVSDMGQCPSEPSVPCVYISTKT